MTNRVFLILAVLVSFGAAVWAAETIVPVGPPSGGDDTVAIKAALEGCVAASAPCTVQFGAGVYRTKQQLVRNFRGTVKGQGLGATIIEPYGVLEVSPADLGALQSAPISESNKYPVILMFVNGSLFMRDLTVRSQAEYPTTTYVFSAWWYPEGNHLWAQILVTGEEASATFEKVEVLGALGHFFEYTGSPSYNTDWGIGYFGWQTLMRGEFRVLDCRFRRLNVSTYSTYLDHANVMVAGTANEDVRHIAFVEGFTGSKVHFSRNRSRGSAAGFWGHLSIFPVWWSGTESNEITVEHNDFSVIGERTKGILVEDWADPSGKSRVSVTNNSIHIQPYDLHEKGVFNVGIWILQSPSPLASNNRVTGRGMIALVFTSCNGGLMKANNLTGWSGWEEDFAVWPEWVSPIYLWENTYSTVVGGSPKDSVIDYLGTGNVIVGANSQHRNSVGPTISDFMKNKLRPTPGSVYKP